MPTADRVDTAIRLPNKEATLHSSRKAATPTRVHIRRKDKPPTKTPATAVVALRQSPVVVARKARAPKVVFLAGASDGAAVKGLSRRVVATVPVLLQAQDLLLLRLSGNREQVVRAVLDKPMERETKPA